MLKTESQKKINSLETILASINNDVYTYKWFNFFIARQLKNNPILNNQEFEKSVKKWNNIKSFHLMLILFTLLSFIVNTKYNLTAISILSAILALIAIFLHPLIKQNTIKISKFYITKNFSSEEISQSSLFMICEKLSIQYKFPSLVNSIYLNTNHMRTSFVATFLVIIFFFKINFWLIYPLVFLSTLITYETSLFLLLKSQIQQKQ